MKHARHAGQHRAQAPGRRRAEPPGKRRAAVRPRYGRIAVVGASVTVTGIAVLGGFGLLPSGPEDASAAAGGITPAASQEDDRATTPRADRERPDPDEQRAKQRSVPTSEAPTSQAGRRTTAPASADATTPALPADSGTGRRIVFSETGQRVWLVSDTGEVERTYLVSGSAYDNLEPGTYSVYSRSRYAVGIDDSGTMEYFVRFTQGDEGGAIGFHTIPVDDGEPVQTLDELGTPLSHGCVRQRTADAVALWRFAPIGTTVVVTA